MAAGTSPSLSDLDSRCTISKRAVCIRKRERTAGASSKRFKTKQRRKCRSREGRPGGRRRGSESASGPRPWGGSGRLLGHLLRRGAAAAARGARSLQVVGVREWWTDSIPHRRGPVKSPDAPAYNTTTNWAVGPWYGYVVIRLYTTLSVSYCIFLKKILRCLIRN